MKDTKTLKNKNLTKNNQSPAKNLNKNLNKKRIDRRFFEIKSFDQDIANKKAMEFLNISDPGLLGSKVKEQGRRKYLLFGPRATTYKFYVRPIFKRLLVPFFTNIIKKADLDLTVRVSYKQPLLKITFSGKDDALLTKNNSELMKSFEYLAKNFLQKKIELPRDLRISIRSFEKSFNQEKYIQDLVSKTKKQVHETKKSILLKELSPSDRRIVHQLISEDETLVSNSIGEGRFKKIEISLV